MAFRCDTADPSDSWRCVACGCTNARACPGGCCWVEPNKCSACFDEDGVPWAAGDVEDERFGVEYCPASETPAQHVKLFRSPTECHCARCGTELAA